MRGKAFFNAAGMGIPRITPAYAGKSVTVLSILRPIEDHPRLCGEKSLLTDFANACKGSPPPMRGKGTETVSAKACGGITPAYAGKSLLTDRLMKITRDHPRLCGEKVFRLS